MRRSHAGRGLRIAAPALLLVLLAASPLAWAHALGEGYVFVEVRESSIRGSVDLMLSDVDAAVGVDDDRDGRVSEVEIEAHLERIVGYVESRVSFGAADDLRPVQVTRHIVRKLPLGQYLALEFERDWPVPDTLAVDYRILFDVDPQHRGFLVVSKNEKSRIVNEGESVSLIFTPRRPLQELNLLEMSAWNGFVAFLKHGVWHIWIGFDHILFLVALLAPSVLRRESGTWQPVDSFRAGIWNVFKIVTLFTLAHTITLSLASLDVVRLPSRFVESVIAASVVIAAASNIFPLGRERIGWVVFGFGLFHGFGFAGVLQELVSNSSNIVADLAGFNIGVEIGQMAIVALLFPVLFALRDKPVYRYLLSTGSAAIAIFAMGWLIERIAGLEFMPI